MPISALPQAPYRQDRKIFPTPLSTDVLFSEVRDCNRSDFPEYGTPHPNPKKWPYHKLIFIKTVDIERDGIFEFFYAADRENQDEYNFTSGFRSLAGPRDFRVVLREYITPRSEFELLTPEFGSPMPDMPEGVFADVGYVFYSKEQRKIDQSELDSLYVAEVRTYIEPAFLEGKLSISAQVPDLVPDKFKPSIPQISVESFVEGAVQSPTLSADQILVSEDQISPDIKLVKSVSQSNPSGPVSLAGSRSYVETTKAITEEVYSPTELEAETGLFIAQSIATPLGDGSYVRETVRVESWPELVSTEWDPVINAQVVTKEQFVDPATIDITANNTSFRAVNKDRSLRTVQETPTDALADYILSFPSRTDIQLPNVLKSIEVLWSYAVAEGFSDGEWYGSASGVNYSLSGSEGDRCNSTATIKPELVYDIQQSLSADIPVTVHAFFIKTEKGSVSEEALVTRISNLVGPVQNWPVFKPVAHTFVVRGSKASVEAGASLSASVTRGDSTKSEVGTTKTQSYDLNLDVGALSISPTIHGEFVLRDAEKSVGVRAKAKAEFTGGSPFNVESEAFRVVHASVYPATLAATSPSRIPSSGRYILKTSVEPYKWGWAKCTAVILDAANL